MDKQKSEDLNAVKLMTVHSSKGLEFPVVYIVGMEEGLFPSGMTLESPSKLQEERRLFYVAMTRAMNELYISFCKTRYKYNYHDYPLPSRFLKEIDKQYVEFSGENIFFKQPQINHQHTKTIPDIVTPPPGFNKINKNISVQPESQNNIKTGMQVIHNKFGKGKVLQVTGESPNKKAIIFFENNGEKTLLLKFAKLTIINPN